MSLVSGGCLNLKLFNLLKVEKWNWLFYCMSLEIISNSYKYLE